MIDRPPLQECMVCKGASQTFIDGLCKACLRAGMLRGLFDIEATEVSTAQGKSPMASVKLRTSELDAMPEIQDFEVLNYLAEGGFSVVYRGEQLHPIRRPVAIKVIKRGVESPEILERFRSEQDVIARMDHPNVARVIHAGETHDGRPFIAMELIDGQSLTTYCDTVGLSLTERLELFLDACHAILHAHQRGVIHRDIKPSNIMVGRASGKAVLKVIDFGVAKVLQEIPFGARSMTIQGVVMGTPEYMSPEQLSFTRDIDARSDIYSLGLVLYVLVAGRHPLDCNALAQLSMREACEKLHGYQPPSPSTIAAGRRRSKDDDLDELVPLDWWRDVRGDLDWIILKAMEKDRNDRYPSAALLAMDVDAFLRHLPVSAARPNSTYRIRKFLLRNRGPSIAIGFSCTLALGVAALEIARSGEQRALREISIISRNQLANDERIHQEKIRSTISAAEQTFGDLASGSPYLLDGVTITEIIGTLTEAGDSYLVRLPPGTEPQLTASYRARLIVQRSILAKWNGDLPSAIMLARKALQIAGDQPTAENANSKAMANRVLASHLEESSRPSDAEIYVTDAIRINGVAGSNNKAFETACLALRARVLVQLGRSAEAAAMDANDLAEVPSVESVEKAVSDLAFLMSRSLAKAEMLDYSSANADLQQAEAILGGLPLTFAGRPYFKLERASLLEKKADLLDRTETHCQTAMNLFDEAAVLRQEVANGNNSNVCLAQAATLNRLDAAAWLIDLAATDGHGSGVDDLFRQIDTRLGAAQLQPESSGLTNTAAADPEGLRLQILMKCSLAQCSLLKQRPLAAIELLDSAAEESASLIREFPQAMRNLEARSEVLCMRALCLEQLGEHQKAAENIVTERQLQEEHLAEMSSSPRVWLRSVVRYSKTGRRSAAIDLLRRAIDILPPEQTAKSVLFVEIQKLRALQ